MGKPNVRFQNNQDAMMIDGKMKHLLLDDRISLFATLEKVEHQYWLHDLYLNGSNSCLRVCMYLQSVNGIDYPFLKVSSADWGLVSKHFSKHSSGLEILDCGIISSFHIEPDSILSDGPDFLIGVSAIDITTNNKRLRFVYDEGSPLFCFLRADISDL